MAPERLTGGVDGPPVASGRGGGDAVRRGDGPCALHGFQPVGLDAGLMDSEPRFDDVPSPLRPLLTALLRSDPDTRFTADEVIEELTRLGGDGHPPESSPRPDQAHTPQVRATAAGPAGGDTEVVSGQPVAPREVTRTASSGRLDAAPPASPTPTAPAALPAPPPDPATPQPRAAARPRAATYPAVP